MHSYQEEFHPPERLLLGPGPSNVNPRVLQAMGAPLLGHLDPDFLRVMDDVKEMLRLVFQTDNTITFPVSGTGSAGIETAMVNVLEPGDTAVYRPDAGLMHIQVETVTPTWMPTGRQFWLELLTRDPMHIVASGHGAKLEFQSFRGEIALIPQRELDAGRFAYHLVVETPRPELVTEVPTDQPSWDD